MHVGGSRRRRKWGERDLGAVLLRLGQLETLREDGTEQHGEQASEALCRFEVFGKEGDLQSQVEALGELAPPNIMGWKGGVKSSREREGVNRTMIRGQKGGAAHEIPLGLKGWC